MARTQQKATPQLRAMFALHKARIYRHHRNCHCGMYHGEGCNAADALWTRALNRELDVLLEQSR